MRMLLLCTLPLAIACCGCAGDPNPVQPLWQTSSQGNFAITEDNGLVLHDGSSFTIFNSRGTVTHTLAASQNPAGQQPGGQIIYGRGSSNQMHSGPDSMLISATPEFGSSGYLLLREDDPEFRVALLPDENVSSGGGWIVNFDYSTQMCFMGNRPVVLHWQQQLACYDTDGNLLWDFMGGPGSKLVCSSDGQRVCMYGFDGVAYCLDADGQLLWEREGIYYCCEPGENLVMMDLRGTSLRCLDWNGSELWQRELEQSEFSYRMLVEDRFLPQFYILNGRSVSCLGADGETIWQRRSAGLQSYYGSCAADGFVFVRRQDPQRYGTWFGGRTGSRSYATGRWICLGPGGGVEWITEPMANFSELVVPGRNGRMFKVDSMGGRSIDCYGLPED